MLRYMLDTNICIYVIKNRPSGLKDRFNSLEDQLSISAVSAGELIYGAEKSARPVENLAIAESFMARLDVLPFTERAAAHYGQIRAALEQSGRAIGAYDTMIAAHARCEGLVLVTNNLREFERVPGLRTENWI
ncbi:MAG: type II toxin-antitoxin system VapC family toxin [Alphaproteobacteria bacterium]|nr:type II toxin-antitoxin system VapC family toxin [Alphaproteobacteria bacterium]